MNMPEPLPERAVQWRTASLCAVAALVVCGPLHGQENESLEQLVVTGQRVYPISEVVAPASEQAVDTAELLLKLPGANVNANGALSGIAQYRGLYGDRVAVTIDGLGVLGGGPNAMDTPLSYASPLLLEHLSLERGIASVAHSGESLGGHISADYDRGRYADTREVRAAGSVQARYESNGNLTGTAARFVAANDAHKVALLGEVTDAGDFEFPGGKLTPSRLERSQYDLSYGFSGETVELLVYTGTLDTRNTGTPALPMDIGYIDTQLHGVRIRAHGDKAVWTMSYNDSDVDHVMDNFSLRPAPASPMSYRSNRATATGTQWRLDSEIAVDDGEWRFGVDGATASHDARITNPNVAPFGIDNFHDAERDLLGVFGQWNKLVGRIDLEAGVRFNRVELSSGRIGAAIPPMNPMLQMMGMNAGMLAAAFNAGERGRDHSNVDAVFKIGRVLNARRNVYVEIARKTRAPSYQEAFLWLPLEATGGLADGRSYIGNPQLASEVSAELNIGTNWRGTRAWFAPQIFYKRIDDYIQGVPTTNATANMVAMMMSGMPALEFANTDAELIGLDLGWGYSLSNRFSVEGTLSYVDGQRTDVADALYRIAPLNGSVSVILDQARWSARLELVAYAGQHDVAAYNGEQTSAGYGLLNARFQWGGDAPLRVFASAENLLDKAYRPHLGGYNRVMAVDIPTGERLYGVGRNFNLGIAYRW
jgi:iron complex outermembrane receptor protein